jgi:hypothetical protein
MWLCATRLRFWQSLHLQSASWVHVSQVQYSTWRGSCSVSTLSGVSTFCTAFHTSSFVTTDPCPEKAQEYPSARPMTPFWIIPDFPLDLSYFLRSDMCSLTHVCYTRFLYRTSWHNIELYVYWHAGCDCWLVYTNSITYDPKKYIAVRHLCTTSWEMRIVMTIGCWRFIYVFSWLYI